MSVLLSLTPFVRVLPTQDQIPTKQILEHTRHGYGNGTPTPNSVQVELIRYIKQMTPLAEITKTGGNYQQ